MGLLEAAEPFGPREAPAPGHLRDDQEPLDRWDTFELFDPRVAPEPLGPREAPASGHLRDDQEPLDRWDTSELFVPPDPSAPTVNLTPERATLRKLPAADAPALTPGAGRYRTRVAAIAVASCVVLLVGSGIGVLLAGWPMELPSLRTWTATSPPPGGGPQAVPTAPQEPPPITETVRIERPPLPPGATAERMRSGSSATNPPLPPPPKPVWSKVGAERPALPDDAVENAIDALMGETDGSGGPLEPLDQEEALLAPMRVFVHYAANAAGEQATAMHLARLLEAKGFAVEAREVDFPIDLDSIRYFFPADRADAEALSASLEGEVPGGAAPRVLDFTAYEPKPSPGYLELWIGP